LIVHSVLFCEMAAGVPVLACIPPALNTHSNPPV